MTHDHSSLERARHGRRIAALLGLSLLVGCASECQQANDKFDECGAYIQRALMGGHSLSMPPPPAGGDCSGVNRCRAKCFNDAGCPALAAVAVGQTPDPNSLPTAGAAELSLCLDRCVDPDAIR